MNTWHGIIFALGCLVALGCRTDPRIAALEQELRLQEDRIYQLQDCLEDAQAKLESCRKGGKSGCDKARAGDDKLRPTPALLDDGDLAPPEAPSGHKPNKRQPKVGPPTPDELPDLNVETPSSTEFQHEVPDALKSQNAPGASPPSKSLDVPQGDLPRRGPPRSEDEAPPFRPAEKDGADHLSPSDAMVGVDPASTRVGAISLGDLLTGSFDTDGKPGDEGLSVFVEPRDTQGRLLDAAAPISVVVVDPALSGEAARIARWDLSARETAPLYQRTGSAEGFHLELLWPKGQPIHDELRLFVRYTTADGRKLHAERPIEAATASRRLSAATSGPTWRAKQVVEPSEPAYLPSPRLETPLPPSARRDTPIAQNPRRPVWSPDRR